MNNSYISIALDGPGGAGKSTVAQEVAARLNIGYLDTGAMYRAMGLYMKEHGVNLEDQDAITSHVPEAKVTVVYQGTEQHTFLNGEDVSERIREADISAAASAVGANELVRKCLVESQQEIARGNSVVMDGRDIGTCVLPNATLKVYLTADVRERAMRRFKQKAEGTFEEVLEQLIKRDYNDIHRKFSPLRKAEDAIELDSTHMTQEEVIDEIIRLAKERSCR